MLLGPLIDDHSARPQLLIKLERTGFRWLIFKSVNVCVGTPELGVFDHITVQQVAVNVSVISTKCSIDILCSDCAQSI